MNRHHPTATLFPYTTLFRSGYKLVGNARYPNAIEDYRRQFAFLRSLKPRLFLASHGNFFDLERKRKTKSFADPEGYRSEEHTSELQSQSNLVCRLLLEKKNR